jgi:hypothetical protein
MINIFSIIDFVIVLLCFSSLEFVERIDPVETTSKYERIEICLKIDFLMKFMKYDSIDYIGIFFTN